MGIESRETNHDQVSSAALPLPILELTCYRRYGVSNIRELLGHKVDLNFIETNPAVRLEKD